MAVLKCKICGGDIELSTDRTYGMCDSCGCTMTFPKIDDEQRAAAFNRGNHFRRAGEFDKALSVYEHIVQDDQTDAEAHWCCALCRFGIEYVEDPTTFEYIPTCHRASFSSFLEDADYLSAVECSDGITKRQYQKDAARIAEVQRGILATSQNEKPFDVFICYKELDSNGQRTRDSIMAQDVYYQLTELGKRVFFARVTLEDKAGTEYEPYIFAALNSAKVMVVITTSAENVNSVWVKNEWSRFIALMRKDRRKLLLPCFKDMDPYDLPEQLSVLQSYDMGKIGFIQDLIRGINKVVDAAANNAASNINTGNSAAEPQSKAKNDDPLLKRAFIFLEDGEWAEADTYCERVLDQNPENALAYLGKLMAEHHVQTREQLGELEDGFESSNNYKRIIRYGDESIVSTVNGYLKQIADRKEYERQSVIYDSCVSKMQRATTEDAYRQVANMFRKIPEFKDALKLAQKCDTAVEAIHKNRIYDDAVSLIKNDAVPAYERAISMLKPISDWRDADKQIAICVRGIETIKAREESERQAKLLREEALRIAAEKKAEEERLEKERKEEEKRQIKERREAAKLARSEEKQKAKIQRETEISVKKHKNKAVKIAIPVIAVLLAVAIVIPCVIIPGMNYSKAVELYNSGDYESAKTAFENLRDYKDSATQIENCDTAISDREYTKAVELMNAGDYEEAISIFTSLNGYKNSAANINSSNDAILEGIYNSALELKKNGSYEEAISLFENLGDFKDSSEQVTEIKSNRQYIKNCDVGDTLFFGSYEQDNNLDNGKEPIEWQVLDKQDGKILVISKYALDCQKYNSEYKDITWETCSLRKWMNDSFYCEAFSSDEQVKILNTKVSADKNPQYQWDYSGNSTKDKVFSLSINEIKKYFADDTARRCVPTEYAMAKGTQYAKTNSKYTCVWVLRTPGYHKNYVTFIFSNGTIHNYGDSVYGAYGVRPAMWIDTSTKVGDTITFGSYEQDNNLENGKEPIEWQVLDIKDNQILVISRYGLDCQQYNTSYKVVTWETCSLRTWMNDTFYSEAFNLDEQTKILNTEVPADNNTHRYVNKNKSPFSYVNYGNPTTDKIFSLSITEAEKIFLSDEERKCAPTEYAIAQGAWTSDKYSVDGENTCWWWLRTPGSNQFSVSSVGRDGTIIYAGNDVNSAHDCVRPAMWISLE